MRRILWVAGIPLGLHTLVIILSDRYRDLAINLGALFVHGHDISDILPAAEAGFGVLAIIVIVVGVLFDRLVQFLWHDSE
jgi:hypothetical protein